MSDEFFDELEFRECLSYCDILIEEIFWLLSQADPSVLVTQYWDDIRVYGDEPVFTSLLFDALEKEIWLLQTEFSFVRQ